MFPLRSPLAALALSTLTLLPGTSALARLGDTAAQSQARYGAPVPELIGPNDQPLLPGTTEIAYSFHGFRIREAFINGVAAMVEYVKIPDATGLKKLTEAEVQAVLEAEKGTLSWREEKPRLGNAGLNALKTVFDGRTWIRSDHATARLKLELVLVLESHEAGALSKKVAREPAKPAGNPLVPKF